MIFLFSEISHNRWTYGNYCIGFKQNWGIKVGFSPVLYCSNGSRSLQQLNNLLKDAIKVNSKSLIDYAMFMFANMKFIEAPLITKKQTFKNYRFYDEREWRVVPYISESDNASMMPYLSENDYREYKEKHNGMSLLDFGVDFEFDDIHYIIVESEADIQKTRGFVDERIHVFTKDEVIEDVIGIDHHKEILPSQEQADYEAALRHMDRTQALFKEMLNKRKKNSENYNH